MRQSSGTKSVFCAFSVIFSLICVLAPPAPADIVSTPATAVPNVDAIRQALRTSAIQTQEGDAAGAVKTLQDVIHSPNFSQLTSAERHAALLIYGSSNLQTGKLDAAYEGLRPAAEMDEATGIDWFLRLLAASSLHKTDDSVYCLYVIADKWPRTLPQISDDGVLQLVSAAATLPDGANRKAALLESLFKDNWQPTNPFLSIDAFRFDLVRYRLEKDQITDAALIAKQITDPLVLSQMAVDKRFDAITQASPGDFDIAKAESRHAENLAHDSAANPALLIGINERAMDFLRQSKADDALKLLDDAIAKATPTDGGKSPYSDAPDQLTWAMNTRGIALAQLGRSDESLQIMIRAARRPERGGVNVSQAINLGDSYYSLGRPQEALDAVEDVQSGAISGYGAMQYQNVLACAYAQNGDKAGYAKAMDFMKAHASDSWHAYVQSQLCGNDIDGAAQSYIRQLQDPEMRNGALMDLQNFAEPQTLQAFETELERRWKLVQARADVKAAANKVGRIESFPIQGPWY